jgi:hypothetical protein
MPPDPIATAVAPLESLKDVTIVEEPYQRDDDSKWTLELNLRPADLPDESSIPAVTRWYVRLAPTYPGGNIGIYPAADGSITATYPHQRLNVTGDETTPWREGNICVARYGHIIGRSGATGEPTIAEDRLCWQIQRALTWLEAAANGELRREGEPYELPEFNTRAAPDRRLAYSETRSSFERWASEYGSWGRVVLARLDEPDDVIVPTEFSHRDGETVYQPEWGDYITTAACESICGAWVLLEDPPVDPPWEVPGTWGELASLLSDTAIDPYALRVEIDAIFEDEPFKWLLLGFPIPDEVGGSPVLVHWQPIALSELTPASELSGGFRETRRGQKAAAQLELAPESIQWLDADNWAHDQLMRRGHVSSGLAGAEVLLIGAGALGSTVAESLVRAGCTEFTIIDGEDFEVGNLSRHTLALPTVGENKAEALTRRLRSLSPYVTAESVPEAFPPENASSERIEGVDVVIDCTASNAVLNALDATCWDEPVLFCSASMGRRGNRLFFFSTYSTSFPHEQFRDMYEPWRIQEQVEWRPGEDAIPERVGCWHPASVIRMDRVMMWAGTITRLLDVDTSLGLGGTEFRVLETDNGSVERDLPLISEATTPFQNVDTWVAPKSGATVELPETCLDAMRDLCSDAHPRETGGILVGNIVDEATTRVVRARDPPRDSTHGPTTFHRGTEGVDEYLREARDSMGIRYLGEWHYHPSSSPQMGPQDRDEMNEITSNDDYGRPNPVLFIVGGDPPDDYAVNAYLFHRDRSYEELTCVTQSDQPAGDGGTAQSTLDSSTPTAGGQR